MSSSCGRTGANRRTFLLSLTTLMLGSKNAFPQTQKDETIRFGLTPVFLNDDVQLLSAITTYLEGATGYKIDLITRLFKPFRNARNMHTLRPCATRSEMINYFFQWIGSV